MLNNCDIWIELDEQGKVLEPGDTVSGTVYVEVNKDCRCDGLQLNLEWYTHGRGNGTGATAGGKMLFHGEWAEGQRHEYPFELEMPPGPYTYRGHYLNVDWRLKATADIPWALDPKGEQELLLRPSGRESTYLPGESGAAARELTGSSDDKTISWGGLLFGGLFLAAGLLVMIMVLTNPQDGYFPALFGLPFAGIGGWMVYRSSRNFFSEMRLGDVDVHLDTDEVTPGGELRCRVVLRPSGSVELNNISVELHGYERVVSGHGTNKSTYTHTVHSGEELVRDSVQTTLRGEPTEYAVELEVPQTAPFTFHAHENHLKWEVEVHVDVPGWPDWTHAEPLTVRPGRQTHPDSSSSAGGEAREDEQADEEKLVAQW